MQTIDIVEPLLHLPRKKPDEEHTAEQALQARWMRVFDAIEAHFDRQRNTGEGAP